MKNSIYIILLLAAGLVAMAWHTSKGYNPESIEETTMENNAIENIMTRSSVRSYSQEEVTDAQIDTMLRAAMAAPSAVNKQPWQFIVIREREMLDSLAAEFPNMSMLRKAPLAIITCGDMSLALKGEENTFWIQDVSAATENLLLAAHGMGLGAVWCGIYPVMERVGKMSEMLNIPKDIIPMAAVAIGHPDGAPNIKDKWKPEKIHYGTWGNNSSD